ncbi:calcium-binding protein [Roseobacter sp. GAI101]|uniref:calcium-binding protein n=1 Tax=Roseobacter sp. (strain GAI101) TaxID=391589 RepID=UPI0003251755|nr:calcium-binding protein [Roseobacter sp. GAI101]
MSIDMFGAGVVPLVPGFAKTALVEELPGDEGHDHEAEVIIGTNQPDDIVTGGGPQQIWGLNGADTIHAGGGPDVIDGGNGTDSVFAGGGPDTVDGGNGNDYLSGGGGPDDLNGGNGDDVLIGGMAPDILTGGLGADVFVYRAASDAPAHGEGDSHAPGEDDGHHDDDGGGGPGSSGQETITDFEPGKDQIDFSAFGTVAGLSDDPGAYLIWAVQQGEDTMLYVDTDGSVDGDHPAEIGILLLGVEASSLTVDDFIL